MKILVSSILVQHSEERPALNDKTLNCKLIITQVHYKSMYMYLYLSDTTSQDICFHGATACNVIPLNMVL